MRTTGPPRNQAIRRSASQHKVPRPARRDRVRRGTRPTGGRCHRPPRRSKRTAHRTATTESRPHHGWRTHRPTRRPTPYRQSQRSGVFAPYDKYEAPAGTLRPPAGTQGLVPVKAVCRMGGMTMTELPSCDGRNFMGINEPCPWQLAVDEPLDTEGRCIFHSEVLTKDSSLLVETLHKGLGSEGEKDCRGWFFTQAVNLSGESVEATIDFTGAQFLRGIDCRKTHFSKPILFEEVTFDALANFIDTEFAGSSVFDRAHFEVVAFFTRAKFGQPSSFADTAFTKGSDFHLASWAGPADFTRATFLLRTSFSSATFEQRVTLAGAIFDVVARRDVPFWRVEDCRQRSILSNPTLCATFDETCFRGALDFKGAEFALPVTFTETRFETSTAIDAVAFRGRAVFCRTEMGNLHFRNSAFDQVILHEAYDVDKGQYTQCTWGVWWGKGCRWESGSGVANLLTGVNPVRGVVGNESEARQANTPDMFIEAEHVYRDLRRAMESRRDFKGSHEMGYRELEMRRLRYLTNPVAGTASRHLWSQLRSNLISLEALYHWSSRYGESALRPLICSALVVVFWPILFAVAGLRLEVNAPAVGATGVEIFCWVSPDCPPSPHAYERLFQFGVRSATSLSDLPAAQFTPLTQLLQLALRILAPFFAFMAGRAIQRKFRR